MSLVQTCKCEECDMQRSFATQWVMLYEKGGNLVILPKWDEKMLRRTRHFCGRAHASRFVERWISAPGIAAVPEEVVAETERATVTAFPQSSQSWLDDEYEAKAALLTVRYA